MNKRPIFFPHYVSELLSEKENIASGVRFIWISQESCKWKTYYSGWPSNGEFAKRKRFLCMEFFKFPCKGTSFFSQIRKVLIYSSRYDASDLMYFPRWYINFRNNSKQFNIAEFLNKVPTNLTFTAVKPHKNEFLYMFYINDRVIAIFIPSSHLLATFESDCFYKWIVKFHTIAVLLVHYCSCFC